jgi:NAD(P)-dependent dehydrogenase (short-subunit alcohol dehydrogenase family)
LLRQRAFSFASKIHLKGRRSPFDHEQLPVGRVGRPEDIAGLAAYLASSEAGFISGAVFVVDGGMTRKMIYAE